MDTPEHIDPLARLRELSDDMETARRIAFILADALARSGQSATGHGTDAMIAAVLKAGTDDPASVSATAYSIAAMLYDVPEASQN